MPKVQMVPGEWGSLAIDQPLSKDQMEEKARGLLAQMSLEEKISQMSADTPYLSGMFEMVRAYNTHPLPAGENLRLGIPGIRFSDGPRGVVMYRSTCFPVSMGRGASWDVELEERIGDVIGVEARSQGANYFGGVCINLLRHPAWGRAQETYGEDPYHLGEMGAALVRGVQRHIMACIKHYACNSIENARFKVDVQADERTLQEIYLPHFKRCVEEGAASVMSAYNQVEGAYCGQNAYLLRDILKKQWGFEGFVLSDFIWGIRDAKAAALAGLDIEMPFQFHYKRNLRRLVEKGEVPVEVIDEAALRILRQKIRFAQIGEPWRYSPKAVGADEHHALAREAAVKSIVLLKNDPVGEGKAILPIDLSSVKKIALIGQLAAVPNTGDHGSSNVRPPYVITPYEGICEAVKPQAEVAFNGGKKIEEAVRVAAEADVAIIVAGYTHRDEGEYVEAPFSFGGDRVLLTLDPHDEALIQAVAAANPHTVVVMVGGSAIITETWRHQIPAILMAWYSGMEGGRALADILFGKQNPSGRLPCIFPKSENDLPFFDKNATKITYDRYHGYRLLDKKGVEPAFAFGFGLSYTTFAVRNLGLDRKAVDPDGVLTACVDVSNTGQRAGEVVVQLYASCPGSQVERSVKELKGFMKVHLEPGETKAVAIPLPVRKLAYYDVTTSDWAVEPGKYRVFVGLSSRPEDLLEASFEMQ